MAIILDNQFKDTKFGAKKDGRGRIALGPEVEHSMFSVSQNQHGQILLTPVEQVPSHEMWLLKNPEAMESIKRGIEDAKNGRIHDMGSFAQFADLEIDDD
ncbi:MAG: hypothetical protein ABJA67_09210 [Chthonomonadales bacterium]